MNDPIDNDAPVAPRWSGLKTRIISSMVMAVAILGSLWLGGWLFMLVITMAGLLMIREWDGLTEHDGTGWKMAGLAYVGVPCASMIWLRNLHFDNHAHGGMGLVLYVMFCVWATDIGAYFTGRRVGGPKLAPALSPNKTWAGLGGGVVAAAIVGGISACFTPYPPSIFAGLDLAILIALVAQGGDLFESWMKRRVGAKDSGTLIPGHGGLLDRVDGLIFTMPLFAFFVWIAGYSS